MPEFATTASDPQDRREDSLEDRAETFATLADELRLAIVLELATAGDRDHPADVPTDPDDHPVLSFSELKHRTGVRDSGRFNYHLQQLQPRFVATTDAGYRLRDAGLAVAALVADGGPPRGEDGDVCHAALAALADDPRADAADPTER